MRSRRRTGSAVALVLDRGEARGLPGDDRVRLVILRGAALHQRREHRRGGRRGRVQGRLVEREQVAELLPAEVPERDPALRPRPREALLEDLLAQRFFLDRADAD